MKSTPVRRCRPRSLSVLTPVCGVLFLLSGCGRTEPLQWSSSERVQQLSDELQEQIRGVLKEHSGTAREPKLITNPDPSFADTVHLRHGQSVYMKRCVQCHGVNGDGNGPVADHLYPRPRDYTRGIFKFTSTPYGAKPRREDLISTLRRGIIGTSMPAFPLLPDKDIEAVVDYVKVMAQRGEVQYQLAVEAEAAEELEAEYIEEDFVEPIIRKWDDAESSLTQPLTPQPELTAERAKLGRDAFLSKGCSKCHGEDGRGHTRDNIGKDSWGYTTRAADLTSGMLHGGQDPIDIYRRILNGINGTPMPGFSSVLKSEPETIWNLVSYVLEISGRRREGESIPAGLIKPYGDPPQPAADTPAP